MVNGMKKIYFSALALVIATLILTLSACSPIDTSSLLSNISSDTTSATKYGNIKIPKISSEDTVMPTYLDISVYNVENYADLYLGNDFEFKLTYAGNELEVPTTYKKMLSKGFKLYENNEYDENSVILAGKHLKTYFVNEYNNYILAEFFNSSNSSVELKKCNIVKFYISENKLYKSESKYGQFFVNGVTNQSAITDVIEYLGAPSHFYCVNENLYYLDYFISSDDMRSGITIYIDPKEDAVRSIEFSKFD